MKGLKNITAYCNPHLLMIGMLFSLPFLLNSSCSNEAEIDDGPVPFEVLSHVPSQTQNIIKCRFNSANINKREIDSDEKLKKFEFIIDSKSDFDTYISCEDSVSINFEQEFILAGIAHYPTQIYIKKQFVDMNGGNLYYRVGIIYTGLNAPGGVVYIVKIQSRNYLKYPVVFDVYWETLE